MNAISTFNFEHNHQIRIILIDDNPWFVAKDICNALALSNHRDAISKLDQDEKGVALTDTLGGQQELSIINESGMYALVMRSRDAMKEGTSQHKFRKWVTSEVLPSIRKTGQYQVPKPITEKCEYLNGADIQNIKRLVWSCSSFLDKENAFSNAVWHSLRKVTGVPSPANFEVSHLPILATEFKRIFSIIEPYINARQQCEKILIKRLLREREDAQLLNELLATMNMSASQVMHLKAKESLDKVFNQDCLHLIQRTA